MIREKIFSWIQDISCICCALFGEESFLGCDKLLERPREQAQGRTPEAVSDKNNGQPSGNDQSCPE